ncbi:MAG: hypothetical protein NTV88_00930 [Candidatus Micrarchaeota archaeon]|nr:hypothetical protein [Candidatus Micrarchaeota archaeon]
MARKTTKKQLEAATKKLTKMDSQTMVSSAQELCQKRDELLQEILEIKIKLAACEGLWGGLGASSGVRAGKAKTGPEERTGGLAESDSECDWQESKSGVN